MVPLRTVLVTLISYILFQNIHAHEVLGRSIYDAHQRSHRKRTELLNMIRRQSCSTNHVPCGDGCIPSTGICCPDGNYCDAGQFCWTPGHCCSPGDVVCGEGCMPPGSVCCTTDGWYCDPGETCIVTTAGSRPKCCPSGSTCTGSVTFLQPGSTLVSGAAPSASSAAVSSSASSVQTSSSRVVTSTPLFPNSSVVETTSTASRSVTSTTTSATVVIASTSTSSTRAVQTVTAATSTVTAPAATFTGGVIAARDIPISFLGGALVLVGVAAGNWLFL